MRDIIIFWWLTVLFVFSQNVKAEDSIPFRPNIVKINIIAVGLKNYSFTYERLLKKKRSLLLGISYLPEGQFKPLSYLPNYLFKVQSNKLTGFALTPEIRKYLVRCDDGNLGSGFYVAGYLRYSRYNLESVLVDKIIGYDARANVDLTFDEFGMGIQLGYQVVIKERFTFDIVAFGPRVSQYWINMGIDVHGEEDIPDRVEEFLNNTFENFNVPEEINFSNDFKYKSSFTYGNFRYMMCLGFKF